MTKVRTIQESTGDAVGSAVYRCAAKGATGHNCLEPAVLDGLLYEKDGTVRLPLEKGYLHAHADLCPHHPPADRRIGGDRPCGRSLYRGSKDILCTGLDHQPIPRALCTHGIRTGLREGGHDRRCPQENPEGRLAYLRSEGQPGPTNAGRSAGRDGEERRRGLCRNCLLYTSDAADERSSVDLGGRR